MAKGQNNWDIFIAHAGPDAAAAFELYALAHPKVRVFLDSVCIKLGDDWDTALAAAQRDSLVTVVLVSANTEKAYYEREEIAAAIGMARKDGEAHRVVPLYINAAGEQAAVPYGLSLKHGLTLSDKLTLSDAAEKLVSLVAELHAASAGQANNPHAERLGTRRGLIHAPPATWVAPAQQNSWRYKVAAFDLDGTLLRGIDFVFSWERVWGELKVSKNVQKELRRQR